MSTSWTMLQLSLLKMMPSSPRTTQSLGRMPPVVYLNNFHIFFRKIYFLVLLGMLIVLGFYLKTYLNTILSSKFMDV